MKKSSGPGKKAPEFSLKDEHGSEIRLSEKLKDGPVVLFFYPGDHTPGCTLQLCAVRDDWHNFGSRGISVFGVNHGDAKSHRAFSSVHHFPFPLLVDENRRVSKLYGAVRSVLKAKIIRRTVVGISPDGIIRYERRGLPRTAEILKAVSPFAKA